MTKPRLALYPSASLAENLHYAAKRRQYDPAAPVLTRIVPAAICVHYTNLATLADYSIAERIAAAVNNQAQILELMRSGTGLAHDDDLSACFATALAVAREQVADTLRYGHDDSGFYPGPYREDASGAYVYLTIAGANPSFGDYIECAWLPTHDGAVVTIGGMRIYRPDERLQLAHAQPHSGGLLLLRRWTQVKDGASAEPVEAPMTPEEVTYRLTSWIVQVFKGLPLYSIS